MSVSRATVVPAIIIVIAWSGAGAAVADVYATPPQTARMLQSSHVVIADDSEARGSLDAGRLRQDIGRAAHIYVAALPARALDRTPKQTAADLGSLLHDDSAVVVVVVGREIGAAQGPRAPLPAGDAGQIAANAQAANGDVQAAVDSTIAQVRRDGGLAGGSEGRRGSATANSGSSTGIGSFAGFLFLMGAGVTALVLVRRRRAQRRLREETSALRGEVDSLYGRLSSDVSTLDAGSDAIARQALVDASERYSATGTLLADPRATPEVLAQAKRTAIEGIMAARVARQRLGLDLGPDPMPTPPPNAPQVQGTQVVEVGGQNYTGYGQYQPGAGNYFGGGTYQGRYIPGGWYARPFWQTAAISAVAFGGLGYALGGGFGGGNYGYEREEGGFGGGFGDEDRGGGRDWGGGGGGGGDWGGGDWGGGGGGGGDWGGGD